MAIMGVALLAACTVGGILIGAVLGEVLGVQVNVGGVGISMILLIVVADWLEKKGSLSVPTQRGIEFWSAIYVPIVVAMAAQQNVVGAISEGPAAILAGTMAVLIGFALVPVIAGRKPSADPDIEPTPPLQR